MVTPYMIEFLEREKKKQTKSGFHNFSISISIKQLYIKEKSKIVIFNV